MRSGRATTRHKKQHHQDHRAHASITNAASPCIASANAKMTPDAALTSAIIRQVFGGSSCGAVGQRLICHDTKLIAATIATPQSEANSAHEERV